MLVQRPSTNTALMLQSRQKTDGQIVLTPGKVLKTASVVVPATKAVSRNIVCDNDTHRLKHEQLMPSLLVKIVYVIP